MIVVIVITIITIIIVIVIVIVVVIIVIIVIFLSAFVVVVGVDHVARDRFSQGRHLGRSFPTTNHPIRVRHDMIISLGGLVRRGSYAVLLCLGCVGAICLRRRLISSSHVLSMIFLGCGIG